MTPPDLDSAARYAVATAEGPAVRPLRTHLSRWRAIYPSAQDSISWQLPRRRESTSSL